MQAIKEEEQLEEGWDLKKIAIGALMLLITGGVFFYFFLLRNDSLVAKADKDIKTVLGVEEKTSDSREINPPQAPTKEEVNQIITEVKENVSKITADNLSTSSSSSSLQKIIDDLKGLQDQSKKPVDVICDIVCKK